MEAFVRLELSELTESTVEKLREVFRKMSGRKNPEIVISLSDESKSNADYFAKLDASIKQLENGEGVSFTMEELEGYIKKNFAE